MCGKRERDHGQKLKTGRTSVDVIFGAGKEVNGTTVFPLVILEDDMSGKQIPSLYASTANLQGSGPQMDTQGSGPVSPPFPKLESPEGCPSVTVEQWRRFSVLLLTHLSRCALLARPGARLALVPCY